MDQIRNFLGIVLPVLAVSGLVEGCIFQPPPPPPTTTSAPPTGSGLVCKVLECLFFNHIHCTNTKYA